MAEAVRKTELSTLKEYKDIDSLPVVNDPLPVIISDAVNESNVLINSDKVIPAEVERQAAPMPKNSSSGQLSRGETIHEDPKMVSEKPSTIPYPLLSSALADCDCVDFAAEVSEQSTAPLLMAFQTPNEFATEYSLPNCYNLDQLKSIYSNCSEAMIDVLESEFLEEAFCDNILQRSEEVEDLALEPFVLEPDTSTEHPLLRLISVYAGNLLLWKATRETLNSKISEMSSNEKCIWKLKKHSEVLKGRCRDDYEVSFKLDYETAEFDHDQLGHLNSSQKQFRQFLLERFSMASFRVAASRHHLFVDLVLQNKNLDTDLGRQIRLLRSITSILFTCLRQLVINDVGNDKTVPHFELIDDIIEWIMCITGRLVRQCRLQDHIFVAMHLLRIPFSITYAPASRSSPPLSTLLQPPALDLALFRVGGRLSDFLAEPEVEVRGALLALCLKNPKKRFNFKFRAHLDHEKFRINPSKENEKKSWTIVDSDGESDVECSSISENSRKSSTCALPMLTFDIDPDSVSVESISALIDQIDMLGLVDFVFSKCDERGSYDETDHISLFAFANWLITTLERSVDFLHKPTLEHPRLQRQIVKRIVEIVNTLLSGLRLRIESSFNTLSAASRRKLYPSLHEDEMTRFGVILAQYDDLCLRVANFILSSATSTTTLTTCWRKFARITPLKLFASRAKLRFYSLLISSISPGIRDSYISNVIAEPIQAISVGSDETVTEKSNGDGNVAEVVSLLRVSLINAGYLAEPFVTLLAQLASLECRSPPLLYDVEEPHLCFSDGIPLMEKQLVQRILDILFKLCVVPTSQAKSDKSEGTIPVATACGRAQIMSIISSHPAFAFRYLLNLILTSASQLDIRTNVSTKIIQGPDPESSTDLLFKLVDALPLTLFTPTTCDLETLLSWIGGNSTVGEIPLPLNSLRCRIARKLLSNFPWEAVNNATGDYLIPLQVQTSAAVAIATAFQRYIMEPTSRLYEKVNSYARRVWTQRASMRSSRSASTSPPRIRSSTVLQPPLPLDREAASFYHWTLRLILRFHLEPSTEALSHLLSTTEMSKNPLTTFLVLELRHREQPRSPLFTDEDACRALLDLVHSGHFALAIEAFGRLSIYPKAVKKHFHKPCDAFKEFVFCILNSDKSEVEKGFLVNFLWHKWSSTSWKDNEVKMEVKTLTAASRGPVLEAFLGATLNAFIRSMGEDGTNSFLHAMISSILAFFIANHGSPQSQAVWLLGNFLQMAFWIEKSFPTPSKSNHPSEWWRQPVLRLFQPSSLKKIFEDCSTAAPKPRDNKSKESVPILVSQTYRSFSSSWSEGLSSFIPIEGIRQYIPYFGLSASGMHDDDSAESIRLNLIQDLCRNMSENDTEVLWLIAYLIGAECNMDSVFGGYSLWDDVLDSITWNRTAFLIESPPSTEGAVDPEKCLLSTFINGGILCSGSSLDHLSRVTRRLPLIQAVSVLTVCPLNHPVFFLLLQLAVTHCLAFSRASDSLSNDSESCFPPGFLLLRTLPWSGHNLIAGHDTNTRMTVLGVFLCRLQEALRYWLKKDSQDDTGDPYGLHSSNAMSLLRNIISLLSDLQQTVTHGISGAIQVSTLMERIKSLDVKSAPQSVSLDAIAATVYAQIDRWHFLKGTSWPSKDQLRTSKYKIENDFGQSPAKCPSRRLDPPRVQQSRFDENSVYGPEDLRPDEWHSLIRTCIESLKSRASSSKERDKQLERLYKKLLDNILPNLYKSVKFHRSEVVECHPFIQIPLMSTHICKGGARIVYDYEAARLETSLETEAMEINCAINRLIEEALNAGLDIITISCRHNSAVSDLPQSTELVQPGCGSNWALAAFRMAALVQRIVMSQMMTTGHHRDETGRFISIFHLLVHSTTAVTYAFSPVRGVLLQCLRTVSEYLLSSGECQYDVVLNALTSSPQLIQLLSKLWPRLLEASVQAKPEARVKNFLVVYRRLPLIVQQCGAKVAFDLLNKFPPLPGEIPDNVNLSTHSSKTPGCFGGVAQLDSLILEAFQCLLTVKKSIKHQLEESTELIELVQEQILNYFSFNFPHSVAHLLEEFLNVKTLSTQEELWHLAKVSISAVLSQQEEYPLSTDDMKNFFDKVNRSASLAYDIHDLSAATRTDMIESLGILIQKLAVKLNRCIELDHLPLQQGLKILVEMMFNSLWAQVTGLSTSSIEEVQQSAVEQLFTLTENLCLPMNTSAPSRLFNAFLDFIVSHIFCSSKSNGVRLLDQYNQLSSTRMNTLNFPEDFPWGMWEPTTSVVVTLTHFVNGLSRSANDSSLLTLSYVLSRVNFGNLKLDTSIAEQTDSIVALVIAVGICYDAAEGRQNSSLSAENLQRFIENCHRFLFQHYAFARLVPSNFTQIKTQLRPSAIINISDPVFPSFFRFLSTASHVDANQKEESQDVSVDSSTSIDIFHLRQAFISLCVDLLLAVASLETLDPPTSTENHSVEVVSASSTAQSTASQAYSFLVTSVLPAASTALGSIVNTVSSSSLWKHIFGEKDDSVDEKSAFVSLVESKGSLKAFVLQILGLLYNVENCCSAECWSPVESAGFQQAVSYYGELLRLRSMKNSLSRVVDSVFVYWMSDSRIFGIKIGVSSTEALQCRRIPGHCRPLLQALLGELSATSMSFSAPDEPAKTKASVNSLAIVNLIDTSLWMLLQSSPNKPLIPSFPTNFEKQMMRISEIIEYACNNASEATSSLANCGSWLVPACLSCKKLLPLFVYANNRWRKIIATIGRSSAEGFDTRNRRTMPSISAIDTPAILLADIMHWLAVLDLQPLDVCAESCSASSQLSGLLLILNLNMRLIISMEEAKLPTVSQDTAKAFGFLNYLMNLVAKWEGFVKSSATSQPVVNFTKKFHVLCECLLGLMEDWRGTRDSEEFTCVVEAENVHGVERLHKFISDASDRETEHQAVATVRGLLLRLHGCAGIDDLAASYSFLCQRLFSPLPPMLEYLFSLPPSNP
ncbi:hypothetical protein Aperf_G00000043920 [Anoplocephala perfoliata]